MSELTPRQQQVLGYLARCNTSTRNIMRNIFDGAAPTVTLQSLERRGLVTSEQSGTVMSSNVRWAITDAGREAATACR